MPGITDPAEEYFKDGLWGWVTSAWKKLVADASGFLKINVAAQDIDVEVKQTAPADLTPGICGWDGSAWRKLPMVFGWSDRYSERGTFTVTVAGTNNVFGTAVGPGEIWIVEAVHTYSRNRASDAEVWIQAGVADQALAVAEDGVAAWKGIQWTGKITLKEGDRVKGRHTDCLVDDVIEIGIWGYKMMIAE